MTIELKTTDIDGNAGGTVTINEEALGGKIKNRLLHAAAVHYHRNLRQGSACTKTRAEIAGTTHKLFRQKGTGRARAGTCKSGIRKGGGVIHGPKPRNFTKSMPKKQRAAALRSAILGKAKDDELRLVTNLDLEAPKTKGFEAMLTSLGLQDTVVVATDGLKRNVYLSGRNIPGVTVVPAQELNARQVLTHKYLVMDQAAFERVNAAKPHYKTPSRKPKGTRKIDTKVIAGVDADAGADAPASEES